MRYKHIIFDIDGTLLDTEDANLQALQDTVLMLQQRKIDLNELYFSSGIPTDVAFQQLGIENTTENNELLNDNLKKHFHTVKLFDGIISTLDKLKQAGYELGIVTSKNQTELKNDFLPFGIESYFKIIVCVTDSPRPKPYPDPLITYLSKAGIQTNEALYIGDTSYDLQCSKASGVEFGLALWGCKNPTMIDSDYNFNAPEDIALQICRKECL